MLASSPINLHFTFTYFAFYIKEKLMLPFHKLLRHHHITRD